MLPAFAGDDTTDELNHFLRTVRVLEIKKEFINSLTGQYWAFCITYLPIVANNINTAFPQNERREKVDYRTVLSETEFERFSLLRKIRKQLADEDAVPPFAVFTDAELAQLARNEELTPALMREVNGIGKKKVEKYGNSMCCMFEAMQMSQHNETARES